MVLNRVAGGEKDHYLFWKISIKEIIQDQKPFVTGNNTIPLLQPFDGYLKWANIVNIINTKTMLNKSGTHLWPSIINTNIYWLILKWQSRKVFNLYIAYYLLSEIINKIDMITIKQTCLVWVAVNRAVCLACILMDHIRHQEFKEMDLSHHKM